MFKKPLLCAIGACVEVDTDFSIKSGQHKNKKGVALRNSEEPEKILVFTREEWRLFTESVKEGEFNI